MRKLILAATGIVCLTGATYFLGNAWGQAKKGAAAEDGPHRIALVDMNHVFKEYEKMKVLQEDLAAELKDSDLKARGYVDNLKKMQEELGQFKEGSAEHKQRETQLVKLSAEFQTFKQVTNKELDRKQAKALLAVYQEAQDVVERFCEYYQYTLVIRFSRDELNTSDPQKLMQGLNRQVMYHRPSDDITVGVVKELNRRYTAANPGMAQPAPNPNTGKKQGNVKPAGGNK